MYSGLGPATSGEIRTLVGVIILKRESLTWADRFVKQVPLRSVAISLYRGRSPTERGTMCTGVKTKRRTLRKA